MNTILTNICHTVPNKMIISKKLYSLPPSYNNIITAWSNVPDASQTVNNLEERLFWHKSLIQWQGGSNTKTDHAFFTRSTALPSRLINIKEQP